MLELAREPGSYRWYYVDVTAGEWSAVAIFMMGSLFSPRYVMTRDRSPLRHAAVNFALYRRGVRHVWVLSEYDEATLEVTPSAARLDIGASRFTKHADGRIQVELLDQATWTASPVEASIELVPEVDRGNSITLVPGLSHEWHPFAIRSHARLQVPSSGVSVEGQGYHDGNSGLTTLGTDLSAWSWLRAHEPRRTTVRYWPCIGHGFEVSTDGPRIVSGVSSELGPTKKTGWGLSVPAQLGQATPLLLESSPFYARFEAHDAERHVMGEVADFARFRSPWVRWMADVRTRVAPRTMKEAR